MCYEGRTSSRALDSLHENDFIMAAKLDRAVAA
jgi:pterin-4a-carbinolamine dehydratase